MALNLPYLGMETKLLWIAGMYKDDLNLPYLGMETQVAVIVAGCATVSIFLI